MRLVFSLSLISLYNSFFSVEIDQLKKHQAAKPIEKKSEEIPQPTKIKSLQDAMGLSENKPLYSHCQVSCLCILPYCIWLMINYIVDCSRRHDACRSTH